MPSRALMRSFLVLWFLTGFVLLVASIVTVQGALGAGAHANPHIVLLGAIEAVGALAFMIPRLLRVGAGLLLATIAIAFAVHATLGQWRGDLLMYGAAVAFIAIHGPLTQGQWRTAWSR